MFKFSLRRRKHPGKIGLALGGGTGRGWAHIGAIQAITEMGVCIDFVAGTSIGALVGAFYAAGKIDDLKEFVLKLNWKQTLHFFDVVFPKSGLIDGKGVADFTRSYIKEINIGDLSLPFSTVATDLSTGKEVMIKEGDLIEAVRASISIPGIFTPVRKNGMVLVDGSLVNPVPVSVVKDMGADFVIAVDLSYDIVGGKGTIKIPVSKPGPAVSAEEDRQSMFGKHTLLEDLNNKVKVIDQAVLNQVKQWKAKKDPLPNIFEVLLSSSSIMETEITATRMKIDPPDLLIQPKLGYINFLELNRAQEAIEAGYQEAMAKLEPLTWKL